MTAPDRSKVCFVAAIPMSLAAFMAPHARRLAHSFDVHLVASAPPDLAPFGHATFHRAAIARRVAPIEDLRALLQLLRLFSRQRFDIVHSITPKAGLLAMVAARLAGVRVRIHWMTGQVWATRSGAARWVLKTMDRVTAACATHLLVDSGSQREFLVREGVVAEQRATVLADGSVSGVDTGRFRPDDTARREVRARLGIPSDAVVAIFVGRLNADKGAVDLAVAFGAAARDIPNLHLIAVGTDEDGLSARMRASAGAAVSRLHLTGHSDNAHALMAAADFFVLPSRREGFGSSVIEAAACGLPAIGSRIYGLTDAIDEGRTGLLVTAGDAGALTDAIRALATQADVRERMGRAARERAVSGFDEGRLTSALETFYGRVLAGGRPG